MRQVLGFLIFSGFLFYNSVYTWPKLLAATFVLCLLSLLLELVRVQRPATLFEASLAAVCLGLMLISHPGCAFSLPVPGLLILRFRRLFTLRQAALAASIVILFYLPWSGYQKWVDPPGNRLLKIHLAGVVSIDGRTTWQALRDAYHAHTWRQIFYLKGLNVAFMAGTSSSTPTALPLWRRGASITLLPKNRALTSGTLCRMPSGSSTWAGWPVSCCSTFALANPCLIP